MNSYIKTACVFFSFFFLFSKNLVFILYAHGFWKKKKANIQTFADKNKEQIKIVIAYATKNKAVALGYSNKPIGWIDGMDRIIR